MDITVEKVMMNKKYTVNIRCGSCGCKLTKRLTPRGGLDCEKACGLRYSKGEPTVASEKFIEAVRDFHIAHDQDNFWTDMERVYDHPWNHDV